MSKKKSKRKNHNKAVTTSNTKTPVSKNDNLKQSAVKKIENEKSIDDNKTKIDKSTSLEKTVTKKSETKPTLPISKTEKENTPVKTKEKVPLTAGDRNYVSKVFYILGAFITIFVVTVVFAIFMGVEISIEFKGGSIITYSYMGEIDKGVLADKTFEILNEVNPEKASKLGKVKITTGSAMGSDTGETVTLSFASRESIGDMLEELNSGLATAFPENFGEGLIPLSSTNVNPKSGSTFFLKCLVAVAFSFVLLIIYIAIRFAKIGGVSAALFALLALFFDILIVTASFIFFRFSIDANYMAVCLTILGYSINSTIVVYDRIRENKNLYGDKLTIYELVNKSNTQSMTRSLNTTITTCMTLVVVVIVALIFGITSIVSFALPMLIGMVSGFFTSLFIAGPVWALWKEKRAKRNKKVIHKPA